MLKPQAGRVALIAAVPLIMAAPAILAHAPRAPVPAGAKVAGRAPRRRAAVRQPAPPSEIGAARLLSRQRHLILSSDSPTPSHPSAPSPSPSPSASKTRTAASTISTPPSAPPSAPTASASMVLGYYVPGAAAYADLVAHASQITAIAPLWYSFTPAGNLNNLGSSTQVTAFSHAHNIAVYPLVINGYGNDKMLTSPSLMRQDVNTLANLAVQDGYQGFNVDFESLNNPDETGLDTFVAELSAALHREGKKVIVSVGPRTSNANGYHVYNYQSLGASADYVDQMLYDLHDNGGPAGPVAPMSWVDPIVRYAEATVPASKILVGLAGYGYNWAADGSTEVSDVQALALAARYGSTWVGNGVDEREIVYTDARGYRHTVWFEDSTSEAPKVALVRANHLGGVALWDLGEENSGVWAMLKSELGG